MARSADRQLELNRRENMYLHTQQLSMTSLSTNQIPLLPTHFRRGTVVSSVRCGR